MNAFIVVPFFYDRYLTAKEGRHDKRGFLAQAFFVVVQKIFTPKGRKVQLYTASPRANGNGTMAMRSEGERERGYPSLVKVRYSLPQELVGNIAGVDALLEQALQD